MKLALARCAEWMEGELGAAPEAVAQGYSIDSRTLTPGELFFAVSGGRFDGHDFVEKALESGALAAVVSRRVTHEGRFAGRPLIAVDDPLLAMQRLGAATRRHWGGTLIGLTGSAGKTTTKEMVAAVLSAKHPVLKSAGNLNNHFGVPLQLLRLEPEHRYAVIEMGMSAAGEIARLAGLASPDWAVVTNVGMAHAQNFAQGIEGIARAKRELVDALPAGGIAFLNADDARVAGFAATFTGRSVLTGCSETAAVRVVSLEELGSEGLRLRVRARGNEIGLRLRFMGAHNATNAALALAVGLEGGVSLEEGAETLAALAPGDKRGAVLEVGGARIINDCYNSNPAALSAMIRTLAVMPADRRILIAGEMLELGTESAILHTACGRQAARAGVDRVVGVQGDARALVESAVRLGSQGLFFETAEEAGEWLRRELRRGDAVLVKGSRGVRLERALAWAPLLPAGE